MEGVIIKPERFDQFTIVPFVVFRAQNISTGATGLYAWLFSHSSYQKVTIEFMANHFKDGRDSIRSKIKELEDIGLLKRVKRRNGSITIYDYVLTDKLKKSGSENPTSENPTLENPTSENPTQSNIILNKDLNKELNKNNKKVILPQKLPELVFTALEHIEKLFPARYRPASDAQRNKWAKEIDLLQRKNNVSPKKLYLLIKEVRKDDFWNQNFLTVMKLRQRNKQGVLWIDVFMERYGKEFENLKL